MAQNLVLVQDSRGILYVGNNTELLEYDGVSWRHIEIPNRVGAWGLAGDSRDRIYVGAVGDSGYLEPDSTGSLQYRSLLPRDADGQRLKNGSYVYRLEANGFVVTRRLKIGNE